MGGRVGLIILFMLVASWACDARDFVAANLITKEIEAYDVSVGGVAEKENLCTLCEEFATKALNYLSENKTQTEIISILHQSCSTMGSLKQKCTALVDYYAPIFFLEVSTIQAGQFCQKVNLCEEVVSYSQRLSQNSCELCQYAVAEALIKLKDPDTQLEIIELLLKGCDAAKSYEKKCKKVVFEYAPLILANAEDFLEKTDLCTVLHACGSSAAAAITQEEEALPSLISRY